MRRDISLSVAAVALVLSCTSPSLGQAIRGVLSSGPPRAKPAAPARREVNCSISRGRLLRPGVVLAPNVLQYPLGFGYTPRYEYDTRRYYGNAYSMANRAATELTLPSTENSQVRNLRRQNALEKSKRLIASGDAQFVSGKYVLAIARYREAARAAPEAFEARLRQALALVAAAKYPAAGRALREVLSLRADWNEAALNLERLYAPGELSKTTGALSRLAESEPRNADVALALGVQLYFSGQREQAAAQLARAAELGAVAGDRLSAVSPSEQKTWGG